MRRPSGWTELRTCPWCREQFTATLKMTKQRYCSLPKTCAAQAKAIVFTHLAAAGRKGRQAWVAKQDAIWAAKVQGMTALAAYKRGRSDGYKVRATFEYQRAKRAERAV